MAERSYNGRELLEDFNRNFEDSPGGVPTTTTGRWIDGTAGGSVSDNTYKWGINSDNSTGSFAAVFDSTVKFSGNSSLKLSTTATASNCAVSTALSNSYANLVIGGIQLRSSRTFNYSFRMKTNYISGDSAGGAYVQFTYRANSGSAISSPISTVVKTTTDWTLYTGTITVPQGRPFWITVMPIIVGSSGAGTLIMDAWFDELSFTEVLPARLGTRLMEGSTQFNGTTSTVPTTLTSNTVFANGFVLHGWIYPTGWGGGNFGRIFDKTDVQLVLNLSDTQIQTLRFTSSGGPLGGVNSANYAIKLRAWQHVIAHVSADATVSLYINGVLSGTPASTGALSSITSGNALVLGNRLATDRAFNGNLAELGIISLAGRGDLTAAEINELYLYGVQPAGAAHFWELDESTSTYVDSVGGETGTGTSTTSSVNVPLDSRAAVSNRVSVRDMGTALSFDGVNDLVTAPNTNSLRFTDDVTFSFWMYLRGWGGNNFGRVLGMGDGAQYQIFTALTQTGTAECLQLTLNATEVLKTQPYAAKLRRWQHVVFTYSKSAATASVYINGVLNNTSSYGNSIATSLTNDLIIGNRPATDRSINGIMDNLLLYNRALTAAEVAGIYFGNIAPRDGLVAEYLFNEASGTTAIDASRNRNDATITGATYTTHVPRPARVSV